MTQTKNRIRSLLKSQGLKKPHCGTWWNTTNRTWMRQEAEDDQAPWRAAFRGMARSAIRYLDTTVRRHKPVSHAGASPAT